MRRAYCTPRWPSPPTPNTATRSPARAGEFRSALKVVRPAHSRGAASTEERSSGTAIKPLDLGDHHLGVAAVVLHAGVALVGAVHEIAVAAVLAVPAAAAEEADADALAHASSPRRLRRWRRSVRPLRGQALSATRSARAPRPSRNPNGTRRRPRRECGHGRAGGSSSGFSASSSLPGLTACTAR